MQVGDIIRWNWLFECNGVPAACVQHVKVTALGTTTTDAQAFAAIDATYEADFKAKLLAAMSDECDLDCLVFQRVHPTKSARYVVTKSTPGTVLNGALPASIAAAIQMLTTERSNSGSGTMNVPGIAKDHSIKGRLTSAAFTLWSAFAVEFTTAHVDSGSTFAYRPVVWSPTQAEGYDIVWRDVEPILTAIHNRTPSLCA